MHKAQSGVYSKRKIEELSEKIRERYFQKGDQQTQVQDDLRKRVCFVRLNVLELEESPLKNFDVIYCQNLLIYFRRWRRKDIVKQLAEKLAPGGLLVLGSGELVDWVPEGLTRIPSEQTLAFLKRKSQ